MGRIWNHERIFIATCLVRRVVSNINEGETNGLAAAVMNVFCFLPTLYYFFYTAMLADGLAPVLIFPVLLASMFSGWMNIVLYRERLVERQQGRGRRRPSARFQRRSAGVGGYEENTQGSRKQEGL
jgi:hypothetical protein